MYKHIHRLTSPGSYGWKFEIIVRGKRTTVNFNDSTYGSAEASLTAAQKYRDANVELLKKPTIHFNASVNNNTGVIGCCIERVNKGGKIVSVRWSATYSVGKTKHSFSILKWGYENAYKKARNCRAKEVLDDSLPNNAPAPQPWLVEWLKINDPKQIKGKNMNITKVIASVLVLPVWKVFDTMVNAYATASSGESATLQFNDSKVDFIGSVGQSSTMSMLSNTSVIIPILILFIMWRKELTALLKGSLKFALIGTFVAASIVPNVSDAYYSKQDWAEVFNVLPNHSAFIIPAVGDTKESQKQFESESFLAEKKVGSKRIQIPHVKLINSGTLADYWVPSAILILLDRTPYVVMWDKAGAQDQQMCVESQDSIEICFDVSIGANVTEEDAAKYLYWFGTEAVTGGSEDEKNFPSKLNGKSLSTVMDTRVFSRIHAAYFVEFSKYAFVDLLTHKDEILLTVEKNMIAEYKKMGITIEYVGIASQFRFDKVLQGAITNMMAAKYNSMAALSKLEAAKVDRYVAETDIMVSKSLPYKNWDGKTFPNVPQVVVGTDSIVAWFKELFNVQ